MTGGRRCTLTTAYRGTANFAGSGGAGAIIRSAFRFPREAGQTFR